METSDSTRYTVTAALPYANGPIHIGHLAGAYLPADIYVRYLRLQGREVAFICGSDEHGVAIELKAKKEGITPQQVVDRYHGIIKESFREFGIAFDIYSRTTTDTHREAATEFFLDLHGKGVLEEKTIRQFYDTEHEQFLPDRYITGTCPNCAFPKAYGDQCERCGSSLDPTDLIEPRSVLSGNTPVMKETTHWYLPLNNYQDWVGEWINSHDNWKTNVLGQCRSWLKEGLQPRSVTRDLSWGIPVPLEGAEGKKLYVWFDAPIGYISATRLWGQQSGKDWQPFWKEDAASESGKSTKLVHFIGKDNIIFHCIIFPIMLHVHGNYVLPENVPANEFLNLEGEKISTSRNWAVWLHEYLEDFPGKQDVLRYHLTAIMPETKDNDFTWKDFQAKNNNELVAIFGNFVHRVAVLTHKYFDGKVPERATLTAGEEDLVQSIANFPDRIAKALEGYRFREAQLEMMNLARLGNKYLADSEPWKTIKQDEERTKTILNLGFQILANLAIVSEPFLPHTAAKLREMLNLPQRNWSEAGTAGLVQAGHKIENPELLFNKIEDDIIQQQMDKLQKEEAPEQPKVAEAKEEINFDDFVKIDVRCGKILEAEKVKGADRLLKLKIDVGLDQRTIVSGIAEFFKPEEIVGRLVSVVVNLAPRKLRGVMSQGMILMAEDSEGNLSFVSPPENTQPGAVIK